MASVPYHSRGNTEYGMAEALNEVNPALNMNEESVESLINSFRSLRELILGKFLGFVFWPR